MAGKTKKPGETAASAALFITILILSLGLALWTDLHVIARASIAIGGGIAAAATTFILINRRRT